jgi:hypothetical protein
MRNPEEAKKVLVSLKKIQNILYYSVLAEIGLGFINCWAYTIFGSWWWIALTLLNIFLGARSLLQFQRGHKIVWELESEINNAL